MFPTPKQLWSKYCKWKGLTADEEEIILQDYFDDGSGKAPRCYQTNAINATINTEADRVAMHAVRRALVEAQAERTGIPLWAVELPWPCSNLDYEDRMRAVCQRATAEGVTAVAFGDLFLQDVRDYRIRRLQGVRIRARRRARGNVGISQGQLDGAS